jgi:hypothetical protein
MWWWCVWGGASPTDFCFWQPAGRRKRKTNSELRRGRGIVFRNSRISLSAGRRACEPAAKPAIPGVILLHNGFVWPERTLDLAHKYINKINYQLHFRVLKNMKGAPNPSPHTTTGSLTAYWLLPAALPCARLSAPVSSATPRLAAASAGKATPPTPVLVLSAQPIPPATPCPPIPPVANGDCICSNMSAEDGLTAAALATAELSLSCSLVFTNHSCCSWCICWWWCWWWC